jgi:hypothetical protein
MRIAVVALLLVLAAGCGSSDGQVAQPQQTSTTEAEPSVPAPVRDAAPTLAGESLEGEPVAIADFRGRPLLINVWSSW